MPVDAQNWMAPGADTGGRRYRLVHGAVALVAAVLAEVACHAPEHAPSAGPHSRTSSDDARRAEVDRLRSLPYLSHATGSAAPQRVGVIRNDEAASFPGYNLYSVRDQCRAELIDAEGVLVRSWQDAGCRHWSNAELLPNGRLLVTGMARQGVGVSLEEKLASRFLLLMSWSGEVLLRARVAAHHDAEIGPGGDILLLTMMLRRTRSRREAVLDNGIALVSRADGRILSEVSLLDSFSRSALEPQEIPATDGVVDLFHANSVEWVNGSAARGTDRWPDASGQVLVSMRHQDEIALVDWQRGRVTWSWGRGTLSGPHDATFLDNGHVLVFDNGLDRGWSRVLEVDPATGGIAWSYQAPRPADFYTASRGSSQRLPNGNTLIAESDTGRAFEVTRQGEVVWEFVCPHLDAEDRPATIVRMKRYPGSLVDPLLRRPPARGTGMER